MASDITILMPARDAAATIERATRSLLNQGAKQVILIDDFSRDNTVEIAHSVLGNLLKVVSPEEHINVPHARNAGLAAVKTRYGIWCDADDCFLPGRVERLYAKLASKSCDFATDSQELYDGTTDQKLRDVPIPDFISSDKDKARLFERNFLPGIGHIAFDVELARTVGYDNQQFGGDDSDFLFRLIATGARMGVSHEIGYRMYAYPGSDSRNLTRQKKMVARALKKHDYSYVRDLYTNAGFGTRITYWGLTSMAIFREEYQTALEFLETACPTDAPKNEILEPNGPYPLPESWRYSFAKGTLYLLIGDAIQATTFLEECLKHHDKPEVFNNLGCAYTILNDKPKAIKAFEKALKLYPNFFDASSNINDPGSNHVTSHPLRIQPSRSEY